MVTIAYACPTCRASLDWTPSRVVCSRCPTEYEIVGGVPILLPARSVDPHKESQAEFFDRADGEFEITRPHGTTALYSWLIDAKLRRSVEALRTVASGGTALTICGGSGMEAEFLARCGARVVLTDISLGAVQRALERSRRFGFELTAVVADAERLPFADSSFDVAYVHDGLHHLQRPFAALAEMARVARRAVSVNEPARAAATRLAVRLGLSDVEEEAGNVIERLDPDLVVSELQHVGFRIVNAERYAMVYRHEPGKASLLLSARPIFPVIRGALRAFDAVAGRIGNKFTVQAVRG
jgi:ubiquinone/menaquinone biosynthesis C-methylase UbiE